MQFSYRGFQQDKGVRQYTFVGVVDRRPDLTFHITTDLTLLAQHRVSIQEAPALCVQLLTQALETGEASLEAYYKYAISAPDLLAFTAPRRAQAAIRASRPPMRVHRPKPSQSPILTA